MIALSRRTTLPRRVDWFGNPEDMTTAVLAALGVSVTTICERTGLTPSQVRYRMKRANIKLGDYRNATDATLGGRVAARMVQHARIYATVRGSLRTLDVS